LSDLYSKFKYLFGTDHVLQGISWANGESAGDCTATVNDFYEKRVIDANVVMVIALEFNPLRPLKAN